MWPLLCDPANARLCNPLHAPTAAGVLRPSCLLVDMRLWRALHCRHRPGFSPSTQLGFQYSELSARLHDGLGRHGTGTCRESTLTHSASQPWTLITLIKPQPKGSGLELASEGPDATQAAVAGFAREAPMRGPALDPTAPPPALPAAGLGDRPVDRASDATPGEEVKRGLVGFWRVVPRRFFVVCTRLRRNFEY